MGASIAYNLAKSGFQAVILDKSKAGAASTSASLGGFRHQFSSELGVRLSQRSTAILEKFEELTGYDPTIVRDGYVFIASEESSFAQLRRNRDLQRGLGVNVELVSPKDLQERYGFYSFDGILGGTLCMEDGHASTMAVFQGYISGAKKLGVEVNEDTEVVSIMRRREGGFFLKTTRGTIAAESAVIAAGAYSGVVGRTASVDIPVSPYPRRVLVTKNFSDGIPPRIPLIVDVDSTFAFGREAKGLLFGNNRETTSTFELVFPPDYDETVTQEAFKRVPATKRSSLSIAHVGLYEMTPDSNPIISEVLGSDGLYCCAGFAGHGFMHAPAAGELVAELVATGRTSLDIRPYALDRFKGKDVEKEGLII